MSVKKWFKSWFSAQATSVKIKKICGLSWGRTLLKFEKSIDQSALVMKWPNNDFKVFVSQEGADAEKGESSKFTLNLHSKEGPVVLATFANQSEATEALNEICNKWSHEKRNGTLAKGAKIVACVVLVFIAMNVIVTFVSTLRAAWNSGEAVVATQEMRERNVPSDAEVAAALRNMNVPSVPAPQAQGPVDLNDAFAKGK